MDAAGLHVEAPTKMRATIARRMSASKRDAPHFYVSTEFVMDDAQSYLAALPRESGAPSVTVTALLVRACAVTLRAHPRLNAVWTDEGLAQSDLVNVGVAIALDDGLIAPAILSADRLSVLETAAALADLSGRARARGLRSAELTDATFTLSNLGMFAITSFTAIINPPQVAILATGRTVQRVRVVDGEMRAVSVLTATLSADHRAVDGADAAQFLESLKESLESPGTLEPEQREASA
jgi:pyruvate dehydrogenase E2 component (dihydrolipoyllysine-residue acetyltransferase)